MPRDHQSERCLARGRQTWLTSMAAIAFIGLQAPVAHADILAFSSNVGFQLFGAAPAPVDLSSAGGAQNTLAFATPASDLVEITFSAECSVWGTLFQYGTIQIVVDPAGAAPPVAIPPTAGFDDVYGAIKAQLTEAGLELHVSPTLVRIGSPLAEVRQAYNAISIVGDAVGRVFFHGLGAGQMPTASAVVADLIDTCVGRTRITFRTLELWSQREARVAACDGALSFDRPAARERHTVRGQAPRSRVAGLAVGRDR